MESCEQCRDWSHGRPSGVDMLAGIEVFMSCGCGGTVSHAVFRCRHCNSYYVSSYFDHKAFHSDDYEVKSLSKEDAERIVEDFRKCKDPDNPRCKCEIHKKYEFIKIGKTIYSEEIPD